MSNVPAKPVERVSFSSGDVRVGAAFARADPTGAPAIVLVPDVHGLSPFHETLAGRFAAAGVSALAVDLYSREGAPKLEGPTEALRFIATLPDARILADLQAAASWLVESRGVARDRLGVTGFCMGGSYAILAAATVRPIAACVSFYGMLRYAETNETKPRHPIDAARDVACPYLGIFGDDDALIPREDVEELRRRLAERGGVAEVRSYPGCGHAFLNETRPALYRPEAARDAFDRAADFFRRHLGS